MNEPMNIDLNPETMSGLPEVNEGGLEWEQVWKVTRALLAVWAVAVWTLLVLLPGVEQISDMNSASLHLPYMLIGLALVGAVLAAYNLRADGHMMWFLGVLLMLAGWM